MSIFYRLQIIILLVFNPAKIFQRLNRLDWYHSTLKQWVISLVTLNSPTKENLNILEVGCATGELSHHLSNQYQKVIGIDKSFSMIKFAKQLNSTARFQIADATELPFSDNSFDIVISASLINIIPDPKLALSEMKRVCKKGGEMSVLVPLKNFNNNDLKKLKSELGVKRFSAAALSAWHQTPPKMDAINLMQIFKDVGLNNITQSFYLNNMLIAVTATK